MIYERGIKARQKLCNKKLLATFVLCFSFISFAYMTQAYSQTTQPSNQSYVSAQNIQDYATNLIASYNKTINDYFPDMKSSFYFFSSAYTVKTFVSSQYGAAVWFEPSNVTTLKNYNSSNRIEIAVFGGYLSGGAVIGMGGGASIVTLNDVFFSDINPLSLVDGNATVIFKNATITFSNTTQHYTYVIMKESNQTDSWTSNNVEEDANEILYNDMHIEFSTSEQVKQRYAEPELTQLLQKMENKFGDNSQVYPLSQWNADMQTIENLAATKYHLGSPTGFLNDLITYLNARTGGNMPTIAPEPTLSQSPASYNPSPTQTPMPTQSSTTTNSDLGYWAYTASLSFYIIFLYMVFVIFIEISKKYPSEHIKFLAGELLLYGILIPIGAEYFFILHPDIFQLKTSQFVVLPIMIVSGVVLVYYVDSRLVSWLSKRKNNANTSYNNTKRKTKKSLKSNKR